MATGSSFRIWLPEVPNLRGQVEKSFILSGEAESLSCLVSWCQTEEAVRPALPRMLWLQCQLRLTAMVQRMGLVDFVAFSDRKTQQRLPGITSRIFLMHLGVPSASRLEVETTFTEQGER